MTSKPRRLRIKRPRCCFTAWPSSGRWAAKGKKKQTAHPSFPFSLTLWWSARPTAAASGCSRRTEGRLMFISLTLMIPGTTGGILYWPIPITVKLTCLVVSQGRTGLGEEEEEKKANEWLNERERAQRGVWCWNRINKISRGLSKDTIEAIDDRHARTVNLWITLHRFPCLSFLSSWVKVPRGNRGLFPVCPSASIRGLCVESVLQAKLVALAYHMWKHSHHLPGQKNLAGADGRKGEGEKNRE